MRLLPAYLRPARVIRLRAIQRGLLGPSTFWKVVAAWLFGKGAIKRAVGKRPESLGTFRAEPDTFVSVLNVVPLSKRERRRRGITRTSMETAARRLVRRKRPDADIVVRS